MTFPKLVPAFTAKIPLAPASTIGSAKAGGLNHVAFLRPDEPGGAEGGIVSEPGYAVAVDAAFVHGGDYIRQDPDGKHLRLEVSGTLKQKSDGTCFRFAYTGTIALTPAVGAVLGSQPDAATTPFGDACISVHFESSHPTLQTLEHKVFVGSGRFIVAAGQPVVVEYKISEVVP